MTDSEGPDLRRLAQDAALATVESAAGAIDGAASLARMLADQLTGTARAVSSTATAAATAATSTALDALVPMITAAIIDRVDLKAIVYRALDELDLTQVVLDRVDIDAIVARADLDPILDRLPLSDLAEYVIEEIDLPAIIRSSTGGIALDAVAAARIRSMAADELLSRITDAILLKRRRHTATPLVDEPHAEPPAMNPAT